MKSRRAKSKGRGKLHIGLPSLLLAAGFLCVAANQARVQVFGRKAILDSARAVNRLYSRVPVPAKRGDIYSADGKLLASSSNMQRLGIDPKRVPTNPAMWSAIAQIAEVSTSELVDMASRKNSGNTLDILLTNQQWEQIDKVRSKYGAAGIWVEPTGTRNYPLGEYAAPITGFVEDGRGSAGLELSQQKLIAGRDGVSVGMADRTGNFLPWMTQEEYSQSAINGANLTLTINSDLQVEMMQALKAQCEKHQASYGSAIAIDPRTGDILALASWPTFDPENAAVAQRDMARGGSASPQLNPSVGMRFEPGSTFKIFTIGLGLETGIIKPNDTVVCNGSKQFANKVIHCAGDHGPKNHGIVDVQKCVEMSCNVTAATWGVRIGFDRFSKMVERLGLLEKQDVGLLPETKGKLNYRDWNKTIQMANLGFGQSINVTPLGLASAFTVFANEGKRVLPRLIKKVNNEETPYRPAVPVFKPSTARKMLRLMEAVIESGRGTGKDLKIPGYRLAGKTGTAQKLGSSKSSESHYVSSFVGYVPAEQPRAMVLVMIDDPKAKGYYGAVVAGPVFKAAAKFLLKSYKIPPRMTEATVAVH